MKSLRVRSLIFPSSLTYGAEPMSILTMQYKLMLSGKGKTKQNKKQHRTSNFSSLRYDTMSLRLLYLMLTYFS